MTEFETVNDHQLESSWFESRHAMWLLLIPVFLFLIHICHYWPQTIDDAFITYRYSRNLVNGHGIAFNSAGDWVEGYTNPSWMLLHAIPVLVDFSPILFSKLLGTLCGILTLLVLYFFTIQIREKRDGVEFLPVLLLSGTSSFSFWCVQGLETPLFVLVILTTCWVLLRALDNLTSFWWCPALGLLCFVTRIDALWFLMLGIPILLLRPQSLKSNWKKIMISALIFVLGVGLLQLLRYSMFGDWLPNTAYAKSVGSGTNRVRGISQIVNFYFSHGARVENFLVQKNIVSDYLAGFFWLNLIWLSAGIVILFGGWKYRAMISVPILIQAGYVYLTNGDWMPGFRFFQVSVPFLFLSVPFALDVISKNWKRKGMLVGIAGAAILSIGFIYEQSRIENVYIFDQTPQWFVRQADWYHPSELHQRLNEGYSVALGDVTIKLLEQVPESTSILMSDIGLPGWVMPDVSIIDVDGLTHREIAGAPSFINMNDYTRGVHLNYYIQSLMHTEKRPVAILAFEQHFGNGPNVRGYIYPRAVELATVQPAFQNYVEKWQGVKAAGDVWNHLYLHQWYEEVDTRTIALERYSEALKITPGLAVLLPAYYTALQNNRIPRSSEHWVILKNAAERCRGDQHVMTQLYATATMSGDYEFADFLNSVVHSKVKNTEYWETLQQNSTNNMMREF